ncbi:unnamed protein product [Ceratitis capitata]|uniref:(Mediterranean fruit fly) hypothetical protein n=1 Tax=Ceratitis capitata TaxID=7213 RepID=A0A811UMQ1_CERCA|nr:unnamed protein product [Ceratitis capitata]
MATRPAALLFDKLDQLKCPSNTLLTTENATTPKCHTILGNDSIKLICNSPSPPVSISKTNTHDDRQSDELKVTRLATQAEQVHRQKHPHNTPSKWKVTRKAAKFIKPRSRAKHTGNEK